MLAADDVISVGRFQSAYSTLDVQNHELAITYTVFNQQAEEVSAASLSTTLRQGVSFKSASQSPNQAGQLLSWNLGTIAPYGSASIELIVTLPTILPTLIDGGAEAFGTISTGSVSDEAPAAALRSTAIDPMLLASTPDANTLDPFVRAKAAQFDHDPQQIFNYLKSDVGYESYEGSLRGARGTLWSGAGNSLDEASLGVALMRASGIPARYAEGTLSVATAQELILSMFPDPYRVVGIIDPGVEIADPANDPQLQTETRRHHWFEFDAGNGMVDADASFSNASLGATLAPQDATFAEVPDSLRHKTTVRLDRELLNTATNLFGLGSSLERMTVLQHQFNTVELVGRPITVGHLVTSNTFGFVFTATTNIYAPYLVVGETGGDPIHEEIIRGTDYQEVLTSFPFGTQLLTGVFLTIEVQAPNGETETFDRTIADRIGLATRRNGGGGGVTLDPDSPALLGPLDLTTISVMPGRHYQPALEVADQRLDALQTEYTDFLAEYAATPVGPEREALTERVISLSNSVFIASARARLALFENISDQSTDILADTSLVKAYWDAPRITIYSTRPKVQDGDVVSMEFSLDLRSDDIRAIAYPIQAIDAEVGFRITRGFAENGIETGLLELPDDLPDDEFIIAPSTAQILQAAVDQGVAIVILSQGNRTLLNEMNISQEAKIRIGDAIDNNMQVVVPVSGVQIGGKTRIGWYEQDLTTGYTIGVLEDGSHGAIVEYFGLEGNIAYRTNQDQFFIGVLVGASASSFAKVAVLLFGVGVNAAIQDNAVQSATSNAKQAVKLFIDAIKSETFNYLQGKPPIFVAGFVVGWTLNVAFAADPPVGTSLFGSNPTPALQNLTGGPIAVDIIHDPLFSVPFNGALLPTVYRAGIRNLTGTTQTFSLDIGATPPGFTARTSVPEVTIPAGETAEISIALYPSGALPPPGGQSTFELIVQAISNPGIITTESESFTVPQVKAVVVSTDPGEVTTTPGVGVETIFVLQNVGNVAANVDLETVLPPNLVLAGLSDITIQPGQVLVQFLTLTPSASVPLNSTLSASIRSNFGGVENQEIDIVVHVAAPGVEAISRAALAARSLGNLDLSNRLDDLSAALTNLVQDPTSVVFKSQAIAALDTVADLLQVDPVLSLFAPEMRNALQQLDAAQTPQQIQAAITNLGAILEDFGIASARLTEGNFSAFLNPSVQTAQPGSPAQFAIILQNIGIATTTYDLTLGALPPGVTGAFSTDSITLAPGEFAPSLFVTLTPPTNELVPFNFDVQISLQNTPQVVKTVHGVMSVRNEFLSVVDVTSDPLYITPGESAAISTRLFNAVNKSQEILVSYVVNDASGAQVFASTETQALLNTQTALLNVDLDSFDSTGLQNGQYTIVVSVTAPDGSPIPGGTGHGIVFVGSPVTATITVSPQDLPQGTSQVTTTLTVEAQIPLQSPLSVVSQIAIGGASDVNRHGDFVYVATSSGIQIYNVAGANIDAPVFVRTISGAQNFLETKGDRLYAISGTNTTKLSIYSLADPSNPALLGATANIPYNAADNMVITDTHVYVSAIQFIFFLNNRDIFDHNGTLLSIDISNPAAPVLDGVLFNENGTNNDGIKSIGGIDQFGGNRNVWTVIQVSPTLLYLAGSTVTGTNTQAGTGIISVIDISNPLSMTVVREVTIPGTVQSLGLSIEGDQAFVTSTSGGWNDFNADFGFTGNVVITTLEISTLDHPTVTHTETLTRASRGISADNTLLGNGVYAFTSLGATTDQPALFVADASDPDAPLVTSVNVPTEIRRHFSLGDFIYTVSPSGLIIYQVDPIESIPATASVQIPKNNGVTPIPVSFSQSPSQIIAGPDFDTYVWNVTLASGVTSRVITWDSTVTNIGSGEVRDNTLTTEVAYSLVPSPIQILSLPPTNVIGKQILSLSPPLVTIQPGDSAFYLVTVVNPSQFEQNFTLSVDGIPPEWVELLSPITLLPGEETVVSLVIHSDPFAPQADYQFVVTATAGGIRGSVEGDLVLLGDAIVPKADPHSHGIVAELIPDTASTGIGGIARYKLRVTNTGSAPEEYFTVVSGLPPGYLGYVDQSVVEVNPGASNYRDLTLLIETPLNATPNLYPFTVTVGAFGTDPVHFDVGGNLQLLPLGVDAKFSTPVGNPNQTYQLLVKNTGQIAETFDLTLSGPGALIASLATNVVTLAPGASQLVDVTVGEPDFSFPGAVQIFGAATARSNGAVFDIDRLEIIVSGAKGLEGAFSEDSTPAQPNPFSALFQVNNTGNLEDQYVAEITGITGALTATFIGFDGNSTPTIPLFRLPGLTGATLALRAFPSGGGGGSITVQIRSLTDETIVATDTLVIGVANNQPPVITSNGGGDTAEVSIPENTLVATDVNSSDPDLPAQVRTYSLGGGADADKFTIHPQTGILSFKTAPNFEAPTDQGQNNVYEVIVRVTDGLLFDSQAISVRVTNVNEAPTITSGGGGDSASVHVPENTTTAYDANSADPDLPAQVRTYSLSGPDASFFHLDVISGILSFKSAPNFENPLDQGKNNIYDVSIRVTDGALFDTQSLAIHVTNVNEAPTINSYGGLDSVSLSVPEGTVNAADANSADPDLPAQERTYAISGGADASRFTVDRVSGVVRFVVPPDFEQPIDVGGNNVYNVIVRVTDGELFDTQAYAITVTNLGNETVNYLAVGADAGAASEPLVKVYRPDGSLLEQFHAYETGYLGGVRVATGDVTGDGIIDVVTAPGRGHAPIIKVFDGASIADGVMGNAQELPAFVIQAFDMTFVDGLSIAVGDIVGDGLLDVVAIPDRGQTEVRVFRNRLSDTPHPHPGDAFSNAPWRSFLPFDANFIGGGTVAIGEIDRNLSKNEVIVGSGSGMNATIKAFNVNSSQAKLVKTYTPIDPNFRGGVFVAAGDINGDGIADIVAGGGQGGSSKTSVLDGRNGNSLGAIYPYTDVSKQAPVRVTVRDLNGDGIVDTIFAGHGADGKTKSIRRYDLISKKMSDFLFESDPQMGGGFHLG